MNPLIRTSLYSGVCASFFYLLFFLSIYFLQVPLFDPTVKLDFLVGLMFTGSSIWFYRNKVNNYALRFWEGLVIAFITVFVGATVLTIAIILFLNFIDSEYLAKSIGLALQEIESYRPMMLEELTPEETESKIQSLKESYRSITVYSFAAGKFLLNLVIAFFYGSILSVLFRK